MCLSPLWSRGICLTFLLPLALAACSREPADVERRAQRFVERLSAGEEVVSLSQLPPASPPETLAQDLAARVAADYLRARYQTGARFAHRILASAQPAGPAVPPRRMVVIATSENQAPAAAPVVLRVELVEDVQRGWLVVGYHSHN